VAGGTLKVMDGPAPRFGPTSPGTPLPILPYMVPKRLFEWFYLATPAFAAADVLWGIPARAAGIPEPQWRMAYYGLLMGCWLLCRRVPASGPFVGLLESSVNLLILLLAILLPIWSAAEHLPAAGGGVALAGPGVWLNLAISGPLLILGIKANERLILQRHGLDRPQRG